MKMGKNKAIFQTKEEEAKGRWCWWQGAGGRCGPYRRTWRQWLVTGAWCACLPTLPLTTKPSLLNSYRRLADENLIFGFWIILQQIMSTLQNPVKGMRSQNFPLPQKEALKGEDEITCSRVAEFMAYVHESYCNTPVGGTSSRAPLRSAKGSPRPAVKQLPSVAAMEDLVITFVGRLRERKEHTQKKLRDLRTAADRVGELEGHVTALKTTNTCLEATLEEAAAEIAKIKGNLEDSQHPLFSDFFLRNLIIWKLVLVN
ncbi:uncharacterized protein LOC122248959 [Penaeus japonicus]|uniref:uncharacterized protein LOC122248959 n=1 Tax=Penaeus japonicus TaxID=27405 RepID=UPI001C70BAFE|nr:uncharacterized protein LOC122248959 [Penaeus japonicus]